MHRSPEPQLKQNPRISQQHAGERRKVLVFEREAEM
jgi:hypothetical protein